MGSIKQGINDAKETTKLYSEVTGAYELLVNYGWLRDYQHIQIVNSCDADIMISFQKELGAPVASEIVAPASSSRTWDDFWHKGRLEYMTPGTLPTQGKLIVTSW